LVLVGSRLSKEERRAYVDQVFGWFYDRSRAYLIATVVGDVGVLLAIIDGEGKPWVDHVLLVVLAGLVFLGLLINHVLLPLHREYLWCLVLLERLDKFGGELRAALEVEWQPVPEPSIYGHFFSRFINGEKNVCKGIKDAKEAWGRSDNSHKNRGTALGQYLFHVLGPVPTDVYERRLKVRREVQDAMDVEWPS
jgi:hypothetical protein